MCLPEPWTALTHPLVPLRILSPLRAHRISIALPGPFELTKLVSDAGDQTKCRYVELISWAGMAVAGLFLIATTCYACYQRVRPNKMIVFEVALTGIMFILQRESTGMF